MLIVSDIWKRYGERAVLRGVHLEVKPGEVAGLVGANGAGKSTLMKVILGLVTSDEGRIAIGPAGAAPGSMEARRMTAYVPELPMLYSDLTAWEHLRYVAMVYGMAPGKFEQGAERLLCSLSLWDDRHLDPLEMSKGMKQKLALAAALLPSPRLLLLDEPFSGLDPLAARTLRQLIGEAAKGGAAVLLSTHMLDAAERLCHRFFMLHEGRLAGDGDATSLRVQAGLGPGEPMEEVFAMICARREGGA